MKHAEHSSRRSTSDLAGSNEHKFEVFPKGSNQETELLLAQKELQARKSGSRPSSLTGCVAELGGFLEESTGGRGKCKHPSSGPEKSGTDLNGSLKESCKCCIEDCSNAANTAQHQSSAHDLCATLEAHRANTARRGCACEWKTNQRSRKRTKNATSKRTLSAKRGEESEATSLRLRACVVAGRTRNHMVAPLTSDPVVESNCHVVTSGSVLDLYFVGGLHLSP